MEFNLEVKEGDKRVTDDDWPGVRQNITRARSVWGRIGTLL